jgi:putative inorganic carbon (hco3(-)) transporter
MPKPSAPPPPSEVGVHWPARIFALLFGTFLGMALLKFGNPPVMDFLVTRPGPFIEWLIFPWPIGVAYPLLAVVGLAGLFAWRWPTAAPRWLLGLPAIWLTWQFMAATQSASPALSQSVLGHFSAALVCFYLGATGLNRPEVRNFFWLPILMAFGLTIYIGLAQHFGGLEETRQYFWTYVYPTQPDFPPEYLQKMQSNRIFSTVFYPNAFAGALLLFFPPVATWIWQAKQRFTPGARGFLVGALLSGAVGCLFWTGSKGGWLLALLSGLVALLHQNFPRRIKWGLMALILICGLSGFLWKNLDYMKRGATSVVARFDYWEAAWKTACAKPILGSGPGTFAVAYQAVKRPESEMARLTHNDYLQQASDSGFPGLLAYVGFIGGVLWVGYRRLDWKTAPLAAAVWLGFAAWAAQSAIEFTLYVPALAWPAFTLAGWLISQKKDSVRQNPEHAPTLPP